MCYRHAFVLFVAIGCLTVFGTVCADDDSDEDNETIESTVEEAQKTVEDYLNVCLDGKYHKTKPGPEASLYRQCTPWQQRSCCTSNVTKSFHMTNTWYNFDWNHCEGKTLSPKCRGHFLQDLCFYECSPNVGPWLKKVQMKIRNEKFFDMPLCKSECDLWWEDCKEDFTCLENWGKDFNFSTGVNKCPANTECKTFTEIFNNSKNFCEKIWNHSWKVVEDTEDCMKIWFNGTVTNPNDAIARRKAEQLVSHSTVLAGDVYSVFVLSIVSVFYRFF